MMLRTLACIIAVAVGANTRWLAAQGGERAPTLADLERRATVDSNDAGLHVQLGRALLERKQHKDAEHHFRQALAIAPNLPLGYLGLAAIPYARGERYWKEREKREGRDAVTQPWLEAAKFTRLAFLLDPLVDPSLLPRTEERVTLRVDGFNYRVWWVLPLTKAMNAFRAGKFEEAKRRCDKLVDDSHEGPQGNGFPDDVIWVRALSAAHLDDFNLAATDFTILMQRAIRRAQTGPVEDTPLRTNDYRYMTAVMNMLTGQPEVASLLLREALTVDPSLYMAHSHLAAMLERSRAWDEAVVERQRAIDSNPENSDLFYDLGRTLSRANRLAPALDAFGQAAQLNSRDPLALYYAGQTAQQLGRKDEARRHFERFIVIAPSRMTGELALARESLAAHQ
jgi:tetratricopeptide (TPR) repeat protein